MGAIRTSANASFDDYVTSGLPSSGAKSPQKSEIRATFGVVEDAVDSASALAASAAVGLKWTTQSIRVRSTGNVDISTALENGDTLNGVTLATGDHVFLGSQSTASQNGIYTVVASGAASRATFADTAAELAYFAFLIKEGTAGAGERWSLPLASSAITVGTTALNFAQVGIESSVAAEVAALDAKVDELEPLIALTGVKLVEGSGAGLETRAFKNVTFTAAAFQIDVIAAAGERRRFELFSASTPQFAVVFDAAKGLVESATGGTGTVTARGNDEYLFRFSGTAAAGNTNVQLRVLDGAGLPPRTGDGTSGLFVRSVEVAQGATIHATTTDFSGWTLQGLSVTADARDFGGIDVRADSLEQALRINRPLRGRKAAWLGTSLVAQGYYTPVVTTKTGLEIQNLGISGASLGVGTGNGGSGSAAIYDSITSIETDVDMVVIDAMTNDFAALEVPLGTIADTTTASFYGAIYAAHVAIAAQVPGVPIVWIQGVSADSRFAANSITASNPSGVKLYQFQRALAEQCQRLGSALIDINQANVGYFASQSIRSDGLHWNTKGGQIVGGFISFELEQLARCGAL